MNWDPDQCNKAWGFATMAHKGQQYGSSTAGVPIEYISHVGNVAMEVLWALPSTPLYDANLTIQCALLHDVIEDTVHTYEEVLQEFGKNVADGVLALSKDSTMNTKTDQMVDSLSRITQQPKEIWMVKMADRIANLHYPPHSWQAEKIGKYCEEALLIYELLKVSNEVLASRLLDKIERYKRFL